MWSNIVKVASEYGPFPAGSVVGIFISWLANKDVMKLHMQADSAHRETVANLSELLKVQQARIDALHEQLYRGNISQGARK
jgi:hypothetical protein